MSLLKEISSLLMMSEDEVINFSFTAPHRYKVYTIAKRNSAERRVIAHPSKELKLFQRILIKKMQSTLEPSDRAFAYVKGRNIRENALQHSRSKYLLKMDFKNFFPSITPELLFNKLASCGVCLSETEEKVIAGLLFWKPVRNGDLVLSIGAPSSPMVSNFVMRDFDEKIYMRTQGKGIVYTRYADDLTFSTSERGVLFNLPTLVGDVLNKSGCENITINKNKTVFSSKAHNRHVTGITLPNEGGVSLGRLRKRCISAMVHKLKLGALPKEKYSTLRGHLSFAEHIEPGFIEKMKKDTGQNASL